MKSENLGVIGGRGYNPANETHRHSNYANACYSGLKTQDERPKPIIKHGAPDLNLFEPAPFGA